MNILTGLIEGLREIFSHKFRSFLTMLGVILGVASLLSMFALNAGSIAGSKAYLEGLGGIEKVSIVDAAIPPSQESKRELSLGRTYTDVIALRKQGSLLSYVSPEVSLGGAKITYGNKQSNPILNGVEPDLYFVDKHEMGYGRFINTIDIENSNRVCVLGNEIVNQLFDFTSEKIIGRVVKINEEAFTIIGIFTPYTYTQGHYKTPPRRGVKRGDPFAFKNNLVVIPLTTMQKIFKSSRIENGIEQGPDIKLSQLNVQIKDVNRFEESLEQIRTILSLTHRGIRDFDLNTRQDYAEAVKKFGDSLKITGGVTAGISLLVGGIGIINTMLASISQRIREIGIRRAIGARQIDIFVQILIESIILAFIGGLIGLGLGYTLAQGLVFLAPSQSNPIVELEAILISFSFALGVGFLAGLYPAWHASRMSPLQALRYE